MERRWARALLLGLWTLIPTRELLADSPDGAELEFGLDYSSLEGTEIGARLKSGSSSLALAVRGRDSSSAEGRFSVGMADGEGGGAAFGSLSPPLPLLLLLDPLVWILPSSNPGPPRPDLGLSGKYGGMALGLGALSCFLFEKGGPGTGSSLTGGETEEETGARSAEAAGLALSLPLGEGDLALSAAAGNSSIGRKAGSWYDAPLDGIWPRSLLSLSYSRRAEKGRFLVSGIASSAIDRGSGLAFRLEAGSSLLPIPAFAFVALRSSSFAGLDQDEGLLGRLRLALSPRLGNGLLFSFTGDLEAEKEVDNPTPRLTRSLVLKLEGRDGGEGYLAFLAGLDWLSGPGKAELGLRFRIALDEAGLGASCGFESRLEWEEGNPFAPDSGGLAGAEPSLLHSELGIRVLRPLGGRIPGFSLDAELERKLPFAAVPPAGLSAKIGGAVFWSPARGARLRLQAAVEGGGGTSASSSLQEGRAQVSASLSMRTDFLPRLPLRALKEYSSPSTIEPPIFREAASIRNRTP